MADRLPTGIAYYICADTIRGFRYCQGNLLCKVRRDQPDLLHLHRLIQKVDVGGPSILLLCPINSPRIGYFPIYSLDRGFPFPFVPVRLCIPLFRQFIIIVFQNDLGNHPAQFADIGKNFKFSSTIDFIIQSPLRVLFATNIIKKNCMIGKQGFSLLPLFI